MEKIPILRMGNLLLVTIQVDLYDRLAETLETDLVQMIKKTGAQGVLIDISAVSIIDSSWEGSLVTLLLCQKSWMPKPLSSACSPL